MNIEEGILKTTIINLTGFKNCVIITDNGETMQVDMTPQEIASFIKMVKGGSEQ